MEARIHVLHIFLVILFCSLMPAAHTDAQSVRSDTVASVRYMKLFPGDSIEVEFILASSQPAPVVVLLPDRYGVQYSVRHLLKPVAAAGYNAYAVHLRTVLGPADAELSIRFDSTDIETLIQIVPDLLNENTATGKAGLIGFDTGAQIGLMTQARIPLFAACAVFYPPGYAEVLASLRKLDVPVELNIGRNDPVFSREKLKEIKIALGSKAGRVVSRTYKAQTNMFCNPSHTRFNREALQTGMDKTAFFFARFLRN